MDETRIAGAQRGNWTMKGGVLHPQRMGEVLHGSPEVGQVGVQVGAQVGDRVGDRVEVLGGN